MSDEWSGTCPKCNHVPPPARTRLCVMHEAREQAIRDCIAAVEACTADKGYVYSDTETGIEWALAALRALLEKP